MDWLLCVFELWAFCVFFIVVYFVMMFCDFVWVGLLFVLAYLLVGNSCGFSCTVCWGSQLRAGLGCLLVG